MRPRFRPSRLVLVGALTLCLLPVAFVVPAFAGQCLSNDIGYVTVPFHGTVKDTLGTPINGASVTASWRGQSTTVTTHTLGTYTVQVRSDCDVTVHVTEPLHVTPPDFTSTNPLIDQTAAIDFSMPFRLTTAVSPTAFNVLPKILTFTADTTAPTTLTQAKIQLPDNSMLSMTVGSGTGLPSGWARWTTTWTVPAGTANAQYTYRSCVLSPSATTRCDNGTVLSEIGQAIYAVDTIAPSISTTTPGRFRDVTSAADVSVTWQDATSGVDTSTISMSIDGSSVSTTLTGTTVRTNGAALTAGIHRVDVSANDLAGNTASDTFIFTITNLTADSANATLQPRTVQVNPSGAVIPPSTVTFHALQVNAAAFKEYLNASTWVGFGNASRSFNFGSVPVTFNNETGIPSTVNVSIPGSAATHRVATLAPSASQLTSIIPTQTITLSDLTVTVPVGYGTSGSTAAINTATAALGATAFQGSILGTPLPTSFTVSGHISACYERHPAGVTGYCSADQTPGLLVKVDGASPVNGFGYLTAAPDPHNEGSVSPTSDTGTAYEVHARLRLGCTVVTIATTAPINLCSAKNEAATNDGYFASYLNGWIYTVGNGDGHGNSTYPIWRQDHIEAPTGGDSCPNGGTSSGSVTASLSSATSNTIALDGATTPLTAGSWQGPIPQTIKLGANTGPTDASQPGQDPTYATTARPYQLTSDASLSISPRAAGYVIKRGATRDEFGQETAIPNATYNSWGGSSTAATLDLVTGTEFQTPSSVQGFAYLGSVPFQTTVTVTC